MTEKGEIVFMTAVATLMAYAVHNEPKITNQRMSVLLKLKKSLFKARCE